MTVFQELVTILEQYSAEAEKNLDRNLTPLLKATSKNLLLNETVFSKDETAQSLTIFANWVIEDSLNSIPQETFSRLLEIFNEFFNKHSVDFKANTVHLVA